MTRSIPARLLRRAPLLAGVNPNLLERLSATMLERRFVAGQDVVIQNDPGDSAYLVEEGRAEVVIDGVKVNEVTSGDFIGELALIHTEGRRSATVSAISPLVTWELPRAEFEHILTQNPDTHKALTSMAKVLALANFLAISTTLRELSPKEQRDLASRIQERDFAAGEVFIEEGTVEGGAYILMSGEAQVITSDHGGRTRMLGTMNPGALFGEARILTGEPANATVKASKPSTVLVLSRSDFADIVRRMPGIARDVFGMMRYRSRPRRATGIELAERQLPDGEWITILRDSARNSYFQLSELGRFIWDRLDGNHNVKDLSMEYLSETGQFMPLAIADIESALSSAGFLSEARPPDEYWSALAQAGPWRRAMSAAKRIMEWNTHVRNPDRVVGSAYRLLRGAFTPFGLALIAMIGLAGLVAFFLANANAATSPTELGWPFFLLFYPALIATVAFHEAGHALSTKHFGRRVNRIGIGWYWFGPIIFVDTTDMWTADRWPRVAVSMAGPIASFVVAGLAGAVAYLSTNTLLTVVAWQIALISYISVFLNFNPLMELDGYFILIDILERPNLRSESLRWLGLGLWSALKDPPKLREHRLELIYGIAVVLFIPIVALLSAYMYRAILQKWIEPVVGNTLADSLLFAVVFLGLAIPLLALAGEIRGVGSPPAGGNR